MSPHFLTRRVSRLLGLALVSCMGFRPCWCQTPFPSPSISQCFLFTLLHQPLDFIRLVFTVRYLHPTTNPPPYSRLGTGITVIGYPKRLRYHGGGVTIVYTEQIHDLIFSGFFYR